MHLRKFVIGFLAMFFVTATLAAQSLILDQTAELDPVSMSWTAEVNVAAQSVSEIEVYSEAFEPRILVARDGEAFREYYEYGYQTLASSYSPRAGRLRLRVEAVYVEDSDMPLPFTIKLSSHAPGQGLQPGRTTAGELIQSDSAYQGYKYVDWYQVPVPATGRVAVELRSADFDTYLLAYNAAGAEFSNDDSDGSNSYLLVRAAPGETVAVGVTSYGEFEQGAYELSVNEASPPQRVQLGETISGSFSSRGDTSYVFIAPQNERYRFELESPVGESMIELHGERGLIYTAYGYELNPARISYPMLAGEEVELRLLDYYADQGPYEFRVLATGPEEELVPQTYIGAYLRDGQPLRYRYQAGPHREYVQFQAYSSFTDIRVEVLGREGSGIEDYSPNVGIIAEPYETLVFQVSVAAQSAGQSTGFEIYLDYSSLEGAQEYSPNTKLAIPFSNTYIFAGEAHEFLIDLLAGQSLEIKMESEALDSFLEVIGPDGRHWVDDDSAGELNALIEVNASVTGVYRVYPRSYSEGHYSGSYRLSLADLGDFEVLLDQADYINGSSLEFPIRLNRGDQVVIEAESGSFDTYLSLYDSGRRRVAENDDAGVSTNSRIRYEVLQSGDYFIELRAYSGKATGEFRIYAYRR